ncbi:uncharacterized protein K452DRAFT_291682 [Aplosporella prunicola CBS 121167]|uniref:Uncharacterized protein n=1 Tax=Aplosporella prunicola CBS 121167 TaxID=1176127 RepID=A0A6A6B1Y8_9PEZI|nr:uncharacterized protein K452DRAFT_291682 [Aplosporella prunicola CBS 121167]KAF2137275.1 hypothetical protein K452DRAFT_291682 [Aplosporella prunicola CBS 121167]
MSHQRFSSTNPALIQDPLSQRLQSRTPRVLKAPASSGVQWTSIAKNVENSQPRDTEKTNPHNSGCASSECARRRGKEQLFCVDLGSCSRAPGIERLEPLFSGSVKGKMKRRRKGKKRKKKEKKKKKKKKGKKEKKKKEMKQGREKDNRIATTKLNVTKTACGIPH